MYCLPGSSGKELNGSHDDYARSRKMPEVSGNNRHLCVIGYFDEREIARIRNIAVQWQRRDKHALPADE